MSDAPELLPCPFCGGEARHNDGGNSTYGRKWWFVECTSCGVWLRDEEVWDKDNPGMLDPAHPPMECITKWNTRAPPWRDIATAPLNPYGEAYGPVIVILCGADNLPWPAYYEPAHPWKHRDVGPAWVIPDQEGPPIAPEDAVAWMHLPQSQPTKGETE